MPLRPLCEKEDSTTGKLYDSHLGMTNMDRQSFVPEFGRNESSNIPYEKGDESVLPVHGGNLPVLEDGTVAWSRISCTRWLKSHVFSFMISKFIEFEIFGNIFTVFCTF